MASERFITLAQEGMEKAEWQAIVTEVRPRNAKFTAPGVEDEVFPYKIKSSDQIARKLQEVRDVVTQLIRSSA
jgi:hypothetical protein